MSDVPATNGTSFRLAALERRLDKIEDLEPNVMRAELVDVKNELRNMALEVAGLRRTLLGFVATFSLTIITVVVSVGTLLVNR